MFKQKISKSTLYVILTSLFVMLTLIMNVTAVISVPVLNDIGWLGVVKKDGSILQSLEMLWALPLAALVMVIADILSECFSKKEVITSIVLGYVGGLILSLWLLLGQALVGDYISNNVLIVVDGNVVAHFLPWDALGQSWRFLLAGFIAYVAANGANTGLMWLFKAKDGNAKLWKRIMISTLAGQLLDNFIFLSLGFAPIGISPLERSWSEIWLLLGVQTLLEITIEGLTSPLTMKLIKHIKSWEEPQTIMA